MLAEMFSPLKKRTALVPFPEVYFQNGPPDRASFTLCEHLLEK